MSYQSVASMLKNGPDEPFPLEVAAEGGSHSAVAAAFEPSTWAMMLIGFLGVGFAFRRSRRKVSFA